MAFARNFYTADLHLGHAAILKSQPVTRPFATVEEMDVVIVERINERVWKNDVLYILGDFTLSRNANYVEHLFHEISARKVLILGNHDVDDRGQVKAGVARLPWDRPPVQALETREGAAGHRVWLSHYAHRTWPAAHHGSFHFYGHSHGALPKLGRSRDVGIDCPDTGFGPLTFVDMASGDLTAHDQVLDDRQGGKR